MEIVIRRARPDETGLLCELDVKIFDSDAFSTPDLWEGLESFVIIADQKIIGSVALQHNTDIAEHYDDDYKELSGSLYIVSTALLPEWQGKGIGKTVKEWQIQYARSKGYNRIVTNARASNIRSIRLNQTFGFKIIRTVSGWYNEPDEDSVVLELKL